MAEHQFKLKESTLARIIQYLEDRPYKEANPLIAEIQQTAQIVPQGESEPKAKQPPKDAQEVSDNTKS